MNQSFDNTFTGWMQLVILIYHITGASQVTSIYMIVRLLVSAYLFLNGYGHFHFYWKQQQQQQLQQVQNCAQISGCNGFIRFLTVSRAYKVFKKFVFFT